MIGLRELASLLSWNECTQLGTLVGDGNSENLGLSARSAPTEADRLSLLIRLELDDAVT